MKCCVYLRVSTCQQDTENQAIALGQWAEQRGFEVVQIYQEEESAWKAGHQRELSRLVMDARKRKFRVVLVWALDRLSREGSAAILGIVSKLSRHGVKVLSYQESWTEALGELGELLFAIAGWVARMESQRRSERTKAGLERARLKGKKLGRPLGSKDRRKRRKHPALKPLIWWN
jgi:DNA invertase Pin-like site-specific DNA recombinase